MKARDLLKLCEFGATAADHDLRIAQYFVETESFDEIVCDRADLILGEKGSGKSAIYRRLVDSASAIPSLSNVHIIPAFNSQGDLIFQRLTGHLKLPENALRAAWFAYFVSLVGNYILSLDISRGRRRRLRKLLQTASLESSDATPTGIWSKVEHLLEVISRRFDTDGDLTISPSSIPVKLGLRARLKPGRNRGSDIDLSIILDECSQILSEHGSRVWIVFDRLDEGFQHDQQIESVALRSLLRAHLDLVSFQSPVKTKLFLRTDVLDRVTAESGFVNATHLRRQYLRWDRDDIVNLIARRIMSTPFAAMVEIPPDRLNYRTGRFEICATVCPRRLDHQPLVEWLASCTTDGRGALNPRNVISLLSYARLNQLKRFDRDDADYQPGGSLISRFAFQQALYELSDIRMEDLIKAEYPDLRSTLRSLTGKSARMNRAQLSAILTLPPDQFDKQLDRLLYAGVLAESANFEHVTIPELYRHSLKSTVQRFEDSERTLTRDEIETLQQVADDHCKRVMNGGQIERLHEFDQLQQSVILDYVRGNYSELTSGVTKVRSTGFRVIEIRPRQGALAAPSDAFTDYASDADSQLRTLFQDIRRTFLNCIARSAPQISNPFPQAYNRSVLSWTAQFRSQLGIGSVAQLDYDDSHSRIVVSLDVLGGSLAEQEVTLAKGDPPEIVGRYLTVTCDEVAATGCRARLRPMGARLLALTLTTLSGRTDVAYHLDESVKPGLNRLIVYPAPNAIGSAGSPAQ